MYEKLFEAGGRRRRSCRIGGDVGVAVGGKGYRRR